MENNQNSASAQTPITPLELLNRQLTDWQTLHKQLEDANAPADQLEYCEEQIACFLNDIFELENGKR